MLKKFFDKKIVISLNFFIIRLHTIIAQWTKTHWSLAIISTAWTNEFISFGLNHTVLDIHLKNFTLQSSRYNGMKTYEGVWKNNFKKFDPIY